MAEDWSTIAGEVADALKSIGSTDAGYPVALRKATTSGGYDPTVSITYSTLYAMQDTQLLRDMNGTLIGEAVTKLYVTATGEVPTKADKVYPGMTSDQVIALALPESLAWREISAVQPLAPAGVAVIYELTLAS